MRRHRERPSPTCRASARCPTRFASNKPGLLSGLAVELVRLPVAVIMAGDSTAIANLEEARRKA